MALEARTRGGQGGKKGHSNMSHWTGTDEVKQAHKKHLRREARQEERYEQ